MQSDKRRGNPPASFLSVCAAAAVSVRPEREDIFFEQLLQAKDFHFYPD